MIGPCATHKSLSPTLSGRSDKKKIVSPSVEIAEWNSLNSVLNDGPKFTGRTIPKNAARVDIHADYTIPVLRKQRISLGLDIFNVFNSQAVTGFEQLAGFFYLDDLTYLEPYDNYQYPIEFQPARTIRVVLRYSF